VRAFASGASSFATPTGGGSRAGCPSNWLAVHFNSPKMEDVRNVRIG
jgi:hypothetical protein